MKKKKPQTLSVEATEKATSAATRMPAPTALNRRRVCLFVGVALMYARPMTSKTKKRKKEKQGKESQSQRKKKWKHGKETQRTAVMTIYRDVCVSIYQARDDVGAARIT